MSPSKAQTAAAERLKEFARQDTEHGASAPTTPHGPQTRGQQVPQPPTDEEREPEFTLKSAHEQLMAVIVACQASLTGKIEEVRVDLGLLHHDVQQLRERVKHTEDGVSEIEDLTRPLTSRIQAIEASVKLWKQKCDDLENRARRNKGRQWMHSVSI